MKKVLLFIFIILTAAIFGSFLLFSLFLHVGQLEKGVSDLISEAQKTIFTPPPLRVAENSIASSLVKEEVVRWTNIKRQEYGVSPLEQNSKLDYSAEIKAKDMFSKQYFEHESPDGQRVSDLVGDSGYEYIILGENLALGNFKDEEALLQAWMDSPGHRENILNPAYSEIGISVIKGEFEGRTVWIAVQHFALPEKACPSINEALKARIESNQERIESIEIALEAMRGNLKSKRDIDRYNDLVDEHNALVEENKKLVKEYNSQVGEFNDCINSFSAQ